MRLADYPPMLLTDRRTAPEGPEWVYELKYDGWRLTAMFGGGIAPQLRTREGIDASTFFPEITRALSSVKGGPYVSDGEGCVLDALGRSDFEKMNARGQRRRWVSGGDIVTYCVFDLLVDQGKEILARPLEERKAALARLFPRAGNCILPVSHFEQEERPAFWELVRHYELEGLVAKLRDSPYVPGARSAAWVRVKRKVDTPAKPFKRNVISTASLLARTTKPAGSGRS